MFFVSTMAVLEMKPPMFSELVFATSDFATLIAAVVGAVVGGGISWLLARQTALESLRRDAEARSAHDKATLLQTILKVMQITNGIYTVHRNIESSIEEHEKTGSTPVAIWMMVRPVAGNTEVPKFDASDFVPFATSGRSDLINRTIMLANRYEAIESGFREYSERRLRFQEMAAPYTTPGKMGGQHTTKFPPELAAEAHMRGLELEQLIRQIRDFVMTDLEEGKKLSVDIDNFSKDFLKGKGGFVSLSFEAEQSDTSHNGLSQEEKDAPSRG